MRNIEKWLKAMEKCESQELFIEWAYYAAVSAALQRRVCYCDWPFSAGPTALFPTLYVVFVGPPGCGKSMPASWAKNIFKHFGGFDNPADFVKRIINIAPNGLTVQALWDRMAKCQKIIVLEATKWGHSFPKEMRNEDGTPKFTKLIYQSSPMAIFEENELGSLLPEHSTSTVNFLQAGYDARDFENITIGRGSDFLKNCCLTLFACTNLQWIIEATKNKLLQQGLAARTIFVYGESKRFREPHFYMTPEGHQAFVELVEHVKKLTQLYGMVEPSVEAKAWFDDWYLNGGDAPINKSEKLVDYYTRKRVHLLKLAMVMHFAESTSMTIEIEDFKAALSLLARTERNMHKALAGSGVNNAYNVADQVLKILASRNGEGISAVKLLAQTYSLCERGKDTFTEALDYLITTEQVVGPYDEDGTVKYKSKDNNGTS